MDPSADDQIICLLIIGVVVALVFCRRRWRPSGTAFGTATWMSESFLRKAGMLAGKRACPWAHLSAARSSACRIIATCLCCGGTGSGKGVSIILPNLLTYCRGSIFCFDTKGDLYETSAKRRAAKGERIIRLAPFNGGEDALNPLDTIPSDSPMLVDSARAMAEALVAAPGNRVRSALERQSRAGDLCGAGSGAAYVQGRGTEPQLGAGDCQRPGHAESRCQEAAGVGGIPARLGNQLKTLFDKESSCAHQRRGRRAQHGDTPLVLFGQ